MKNVTVVLLTAYRSKLCVINNGRVKNQFLIFTPSYIHANLYTRNDIMLSIVEATVKLSRLTMCFVSFNMKFFERIVVQGIKDLFTSHH